MYPSRNQSYPVRFVQFFRSNEACDEAIGHVLGSCCWYLILPDKDDGVCTGVATRHALGKASYFVSIGVGTLGSCLGVGNELLIFKLLAAFPYD
jgi:hypothetical protein